MRVVTSFVTRGCRGAVPCTAEGSTREVRGICSPREDELQTMRRDLEDTNWRKMAPLFMRPEDQERTRRRPARWVAPTDHTPPLSAPTSIIDVELSRAKLLVLDATGRRDPRREAASPDAASTAAEWAPDKALQCQTPRGCPRKAAAGQAAQPPLGKAARLRGRRPSAPKAVATEEGPQAPERPPGALPDEAAREASTGRAVGVVAATAAAAAAAALGAAAKSEGAAGTHRGPNLWTKNERQNPGGQRGATGSDASCATQ
ncbi:uncharacterized protein LOC126233554 [Schistocerca nitens]|uniref:uncharacterized protein LOC126233554 n=1 Tax=Schistocerca nitens TaxID=7011 RepID=UPI002117F7A3|nr:uncharacterized protein LOC126233554 [Schistocerca nitens]